MASELIERYRQLRLDYSVAYRARDFDTAYYALGEMLGLVVSAPTRQSKENFELEWSEAGIRAAMALVEKERNRGAGGGKVRRIPIEHVSPNVGTPGYDPYYYYGY